MYRTGRVGGRARVTGHGLFIQKTYKSALGGTAERSKRGLISRATKTSVNVSRRGATTLDLLAFSSAMRDATTNTLLFHKTCVMRYDPLKKNVVRPFRALFSLVVGIARGILHSALTAATSTAKLLTKKLRRHSRRKASNTTPIQVPNPRLMQTTEAVCCQTKPAEDTAVKAESPELVSHPILCSRRSTSLLLPSLYSPAVPPRCASAMGSNEAEIDVVLKTYNTSESRDRLISKLKSMKCGSTDCVRSLSQRNHTADNAEPITRQQLLACKQEIVSLSKQLGSATERSRGNPRYRRCVSSVSGSFAPNDVESLLHLRSQAPDARKTPNPFEGAPRTKRFSTDCTKPTSSLETSTSHPTRSETVRMMLKKHESMVDSLKSRQAVQRILNGKKHQRSASDVGVELK